MIKQITIRIITHYTRDISSYENIIIIAHFKLHVYK